MLSIPVPSSLQEHLPLLLLLAPLLAAAISLTGKLLPPAATRLPAFIIWAAGTAGVLLLCAPDVFASASLTTAIGGWEEPYGIELELNGMSWTASLLGLIIGAAVWRETCRADKCFGRSSSTYPNTSPDTYTNRSTNMSARRFGPGFYFFFYTAFLSLTGVLCTRDFFNLFVWFEILSLCSFVLIAYEQHLRSLLAAFRYLMVSTVSIMFYLLGLWLLYRYSGSLSISGAASLLDSGVYKPELGAALALLSAGILTRSAAVPFHSWLPEAHGAAPYPVSALLSGLVIKAPVFALVHVLGDLSFPALRSLFIVLGIFGALLGAGGALVQRDIKFLLGYSSVSHMGLIIALFASEDALAPSAMLFYIIAHGLAKSLLFLTLGGVSSSLQTRDLFALRGSLLRFPLHAAASLIGIATLVGMPFTAGYPAKLLASKLIPYSPLLEVLLVIASVISAAALLRLLLLFLPGRFLPGQFFTGRELPGAAAVKNREASMKSASPGGPLFLAAACIAAGVIPQLLFPILTTLTAEAGTVASHHQWYAAGSAGKSAAIIAAAALLAGTLFLPTGRIVSERVRELKSGLHGSLRLLVFGMFFFFLYGMLML